MLNYSLMNSDQPLNTSLQPASLSREMLLEAVASWHLPQQDFEAGTSPSVEHITNDSRKVTSGSLFVAIPGAELDGWQFVPKALTAGAKYIVGEHVLSQEEKALFEQVDASYIAVSSAHEALAALAQALWHYPSKHLRLVGVTGTNGKTSTATMLHRLFERLGYKSGLIGTVENRIGNEIIPATHTTPDPIALAQLLYRMQQAGCSHVFMEVSSHALALDRVIGCDFDVAVFTNLSHEHLDLHKTMENYARTKELLFTQLGHTVKNGRLKTAVLNIDDEHSKEYRLHTPAEVITYGINDKSADFYADNISFDDWKMKFDLHFLGDVYKIETHLVGMFNVYNVLAAICAAFAKGIGIEESAKALKSFTGVGGRMEVLHTDKGYKIIIDFAHTPDGLLNVLETLSKVSHKRIITLIGHSGGNRDSSMRPDLGRIALENSDEVVFTADNPRNESIAHIVEGLISDCDKTNYTVIEDRKEAIEHALKMAGEGDIVLLAGKGVEPYQVIGNEYLPYSEIDTVREILGRM